MGEGSKEGMPMTRQDPLPHILETAAFTAVQLAIREAYAARTVRCCHGLDDLRAEQLALAAEHEQQRRGHS